jgi:CrcB protein
MLQLLLIFLGGGLGSLARYWLSLTITRNLETNFHFGTLAVNILGSFLIGIFLVISERNSIGLMRPLLVTGFCGGFTTFSTFAYENYKLIQAGDYLSTTAYTGMSLFWGVAATALGVALTRMLP